MPNTEGGFFDAEAVQQSLKEIQDLQMEVLIFTSYADYAPLSEHRRHIEVLKVLLEKQKNMYYRMALSKDPEAKEMMTEVETHFRESGYHVEPGNGFAVFDKVKEDVIDGLEKLEKDLGGGDDDSPGKFLF